jgi:DNA-binding response OmpR family regulator
VEQGKKVLSILIVEDEVLIRKKLVEYVKLEYQTIYEADSEDGALKVYKDKKPDLLILDINLREGSGLSLLRKIREYDHSTKAIVLSAFDDREYLMEAIDLKLTKYLVKPVKRKEFKEALIAVEKELKIFKVESQNILEFQDGYIWDYKKEQLLQNDHIVTLGSKEYELLKLFCDNPNKELTYEDISNYIWDYTPADKTNAIKVVLKKLRKNIPKDTIINIYGIGYKLAK